jgi:hypothetical protein
VAIVDPIERRVVWALTGLWMLQHHPTLLANGNLLVFDNLGNGGRSRVIEVEPLTQQLVWEYPGDGRPSLLSPCCGSAERLPNGNTLILEAVNGRILEVSQSKSTVWEFINPARHGEDNRLVATIFAVERLSAESLEGWLPGRLPGSVALPGAETRTRPRLSAAGSVVGGSL